MLTSPNAKATVPKSSPPQTLLLPFGKNLYLVPATAIKSYAKFANDQIKTGEDLGALLATKAPEKWKPYCKPDYLTCIEGETGKCVYTTFDVPGWPEERRFLRLISATVASKNFSQDQGGGQQGADHQRAAEDAHGGARLEQGGGLPQPRADQPRDREVGDRHGRGGWPSRASRRPRAKKRAKPGSTQEEEAEAKRKQYICHEEFVKQPPGTTYKINEVGGLLHVLFYRTAATVVDIGGGGGGVGEEEEEAEEP